MKKARPKVPSKGRAPTGRGKASIKVSENATDNERWALLARRLGVELPNLNRSPILLNINNTDLGMLLFFTEIAFALAKKEPEFKRPKAKRGRGPGKHLLDKSKSAPDALRKRKSRLHRKIKQWEAKLLGEGAFDLEEYWRELAAELGVDPADL
jgi:hypothetical protein